MSTELTPKAYIKFSITKFLFTAYTPSGTKLILIVYILLLGIRLIFIVYTQLSNTKPTYTIEIPLFIINLLIIITFISTSHIFLIDPSSTIIYTSIDYLSLINP